MPVALPTSERELKLLRIESVTLLDAATAKDDAAALNEATALRESIDDALDSIASAGISELVDQLRARKVRLEEHLREAKSWPMNGTFSFEKIELSPEQVVRDASPAAPAGLVTSPNADLSWLHPLVRQQCRLVLSECQELGLPFKIYEAWRSPSRQHYLYEKGRTKPGKIVTYARAWESYHQYGLAADFVGFINGQWTWDLPDDLWRKLHRIGRKNGLERLGFEAPHLQLAGLKIGELMEGDWPDGGDASWLTNLSNAASTWAGVPNAPPVRGHDQDRPALTLNKTGWAELVKPDASDWHSRNDGQEWRYDGRGIFLRDDEQTPLRSPGAPTTCQAILETFSKPVQACSLKFRIPPELIVMTIAVETGFARDSRFTGPKTFRWEPHVKVNDVAPPTFGDYSAGPMQTLATTARSVISREKLGYDPLTVAPYYPSEPSPAPKDNPLYDGDLNIELGCAEIKTRLAHTGYDPVLVAAAYNAGGLYKSEQNAWHLRTSNDHLNRAARWYGDACFILKSFGR